MPMFDLKFDETHPAHPAPVVSAVFSKAKKRNQMSVSWDSVRLDTGADITTIPRELSAKLRLNEKDAADWAEYGGDKYPVYYIDVEVASLPILLNIRTIVSDVADSYVLLGINALSKWNFVAFSWPLNVFLVDPAGRIRGS